MERRAVRILNAAGTEVDVPLGAFTAGQFAQYDGTQLLGAPAVAPVAPATTMTLINPQHWWSAANVVIAGGLVTTLQDKGRLFVAGAGQKDFTAIAGSVAQSTDGLGNKYMQGNGATTKYQAGVAADWTYLHADVPTLGVNTGPLTVGLLYHHPATFTAIETLLDTNNGVGRAGIGIEGKFQHNNATDNGFTWTTYNAGGSFVAIYVESNARVNATLTCCVIQIFGMQIQMSAPVPANASTLHLEAIIREFGVDTGMQTRASTTTNGAANTVPAVPLTLFARGNGVQPSQARLYELWIENAIVPLRKIQLWEAYCAATYGSIG